MEAYPVASTRRSRPSLRAALDELSSRFFEGLLEAVREASFAEIEEARLALDAERGLKSSSRSVEARSPAAKPRAARGAKPRSARPQPAAPPRASEKKAKGRAAASPVAGAAQLELPVVQDAHDAAYAGVTIDDPRAVLSALEAAAPPVPAASSPTEATPPAMPAAVVPLREGEELVKASRGGGVVLRRRRASSEPT